MHIALVATDSAAALGRAEGARGKKGGGGVGSSTTAAAAGGGAVGVASLGNNHIVLVTASDGLFARRFVRCCFKQ